MEDFFAYFSLCFSDESPCSATGANVGKVPFLATVSSHPLLLPTRLLQSSGSSLSSSSVVSATGANVGKVPFLATVSSHPLLLPTRLSQSSGSSLSSSNSVVSATG